MTPQVRITELLGWAKERGLEPKRPRPSDKYLEPITQKIQAFRDLKPHQRKLAYWLPTQKGLAELGLSTERKEVKSLTVLKGQYFTGAGEGEHEAALSILNQMRRASLATGRCY